VPIKSFTFAFKLDAKDLLAYIADRNIAVDIHATGTHRPGPKALPAPTGRLALPPPGKTGSQRFIQAYFAQHPKETVSIKQVAALLEGAGFSPRSNYGVIHLLLGKGMVRRVGKGQYRATARAQA
jgi:hypothetical protein